MSLETRSLRVCVTLVLLALAAAGTLPLAAASQGVVNVNTAEIQELALLPRIGETVAQRIVEFREANGRFKQAEDLMLVRGIGERVFEQIRPYVTLEGPTTLEEKVRSGRPGASASEEGGEAEG